MNRLTTRRAALLAITPAVFAWEAIAGAVGGIRKARLDIANSWRHLSVTQKDPPHDR